jgi:methionine-rich copper-binding protein CopC
MDALGHHRSDGEIKSLKHFYRIITCSLSVIVSAVPTLSFAHSFPIRSEPRVGWTIANAPPKVTIWFDGGLEPVFSTITVYNAAKQQVDKNDSRVSGSDNSILEVDLPPLPAGSYRVYWKALSKDTHVTEGDFTFAIAGKSK